jgi:hypothetical protein
LCSIAEPLASAMFCLVCFLLFEVLPPPEREREKESLSVFLLVEVLVSPERERKRQGERERVSEGSRQRTWSCRERVIVYEYLSIAVCRSSYMSRYSLLLRERERKREREREKEFLREPDRDMVLQRKSDRI